MFYFFVLCFKLEALRFHSLNLFVLCFKLEALRFHSLNATNMEEIDKIL